MPIFSADPEETGKTTLARIFAKALNCLHPTADYEPCNACSSCKEITSGHSLDVLEIDGASHRGIDDIRQINETVGYATSSGKYKIYIIDEVHMLTKEAFNALLKTLEEPPPKVKFFFATTEPHKVLPTILSRCQRFNLNRIPAEKIADKLGQITKDLGVKAHDDALRILANRADGGLRDAESLLDQIMAFHEGDLDANTVSSILGIMPRDVFFELDRAGKEGNLAMAFEVAGRVFSQGKDLVHFVETLTEHFRNILMVKLSGKAAPFLSLSEQDRNRYEESAKLYAQEQCLTILDFLLEAQGQIRFASSGRIALEAILLRIMRSHQRLPVEYLVRRLAEMEQNLSGTQASPPTPQTQTSKPQPPPKPTSSPLPQPAAILSNESITEDPTPTRADLGLKEIPQAKKETLAAPQPPAPIELGARPTEEAKSASLKRQGQYDTLLQFAAVELEGTIQKKQSNRF